MRALRAVLLIALYVLFPAALVLAGLESYVGYERTRREEAAFLSMERRLKALRDAIVLETDRLRIAREAQEALCALPDLTAGSVRAAREVFEARHPGILSWAVLRARAGEPVSLVHADPGRAQALLPFAASHLMGHGPEAALGTVPRLCESVTKSEPYLAKLRVAGLALFGKTLTLSYMVGRSGELISVRPRERAEIFYWTPLFAGRSLSGATLRGVLLLFLDEARFRASHTPALLVERANAAAHAAQGMRISLHEGERTLEAELFRLDPALPSPLPVGAETPARVRGGATLVSTLRIDDRRSLCVSARISRHSVYPDGTLLLALGRALLALFCLASGAFALLSSAGRIAPFIPVRVRLVALFLFAALPPLAVIVSFGFRYLQEREASLERETFDRIRERIALVDDEVRRDRASLRAQCDAQLSHPEVSGKTSTAEIDLQSFRARIKDHLDSGRFDVFAIADSAGTYHPPLVKYSDHPLMQTIMPKLCVMIQRYTNDPTYRPDLESLKPANDSIAGLFFANRFDFADQMVRNAGEIHTFKFLQWHYSFYLRPILDPKGTAYATFLVVIDLATVHYDALKRLLAEANGRAEHGIRFFAISTQERHRRYPEDGSLDAAELLGLFDRVIAERAPVQAFLRLSESDTGEVLAYAAPLKEADGYLLAGTIPAATIREELDWNFRLFLLLLLAVAGCAAAVGLALARSLVRPVRALTRGVKAVSAGDLEHRVEIGSRDEFGELASTFNEMVGGLREKARMSRYVSEFVRDAVKGEDAEARSAAGERRKGTILFSDLRDFTTLSELHPPEEIVALLNEYLGAMTVEIKRHGGVVDKFIGDAVMAVFYPPAGDERAAVRAALAMREALARFNGARRSAGKFEVENGIGVNTGVVIQGAIGAREHRIDLTVVGDAVNVAARLESLSKKGRYTRIILSGTTLRACADLVAAEDLGEISVKGKREPVRVFEVTGLLPPEAPVSGNGENNC